MGKVICVFLAAFSLVFGLSACQTVEAGNGESAMATGTSVIEESLTEELIREIDNAYLEESASPEYSTTIGRVELAEKYTEKWKQVADAYYNKIMEYDGLIQPNEAYASSDDLHVFVSNMKTNWEQYHQVQCANYGNVLQSIYGAGTAAGPIFADYKYELQKAWALQLVGICQQLGIE